MEVRFVPPELRRLDKLRCEALALSFFEDDRPLVGTAGLVDWRLGGMLSKLLLRGRLTGARGEVALLPPRPRLPLHKLFLFGLGARSGFDAARQREAIDLMLTTLAKARVRTSAVALPGRAEHLAEAGPSMAIFLELAAGHTEHDEVTLVETPEAQREMEPVLEQERRRARARE